MKRIHLCYDKVGLLANVSREWPVTWLTDDDGRPFATKRDALAAIRSVETPFIPMGCPTPDTEGRCPGHDS